MTSESTSTNHGRALTHETDQHWHPIVADLAFWSIAGAGVAAFSGPLGRWWGVPPDALLAGGALFAVAGTALWLVLRKIRPMPRRLVWSFGAVNMSLAPIAWAAALCHWLPVSTAGNWAVASAGDAALVLGAWQLSVLRRG